MWYPGQDWRVVESLKTLRGQLRPLAPNTPALAFGTIADDQHSVDSDHYPHYYDVLGPIAVVCALDFPLAEQLDPRKVLEAIRVSRDPRVKYGISNGEMFSSYPTSLYPAWTWRPYGGSDGHFTHGHLSVLATILADNTRIWSVRIGRKPTMYVFGSAGRLYAGSPGSGAIQIAGSLYNKFIAKGVMDLGVIDDEEELRELLFVNSDSDTIQSVELDAIRTMVREEIDKTRLVQS